MAGGDTSTASCKSSKQPAHVRAGIWFPIGETAIQFKDYIYGSCPQFTDHATVFLAAYLNYLAAEFCELSGNAAMKENAEIIKAHHVYSAVRDDNELSEMLHKVETEICNNEDDDDEYDYNSDEEDEDEIPSDIVEECDDDSTDEENVTNDGDDDNQECESVVIGQMSIAPGHVELYMRLIHRFGEIVPPSLHKYKVEPICVALKGLLELVKTMADITPEEISEEMVSHWEGMVSFYGEIGLKVDWLEARVLRYDDWLVRRLGVDANQLRGRVAAKQEELKEKQKEVSALESELRELSAELKTAYLTQSEFGFSFFD